jgi:hypothetical protein
MFISLGLALLGQSSMALALENKMGSGLLVYPNTGPLSTFKGVSWRYNGEMIPWGSHSELDFVPTVKDKSAVEELEANTLRWLAYPEITSVFCLEFRKFIQVITANATAYTSGNNISVPDSVDLHKRITASLRGNDGNGLLLGAPTFHGTHDAIDGLAYQWMNVSHIGAVRSGHF